MVGWCEGVVYLTLLGHPADIGLQLGRACCSCRTWGGRVVRRCHYHYLNPIKLRILTEGKKKMQCARNRNAALSSCLFFLVQLGVVWWCEGVVYLTSLGRPADIGLQLSKACYPCSR